MSNIACFNELSAKPICQTADEAHIRLQRFVNLMGRIRSHTGVTKVRHADDLTQIFMTRDMTVQDFCNANIRSPYAIALLSMFIKPQVDLEDDNSLQSYLDTTTIVRIDSEHTETADGFNSAYCQGTFCVGFDSDKLWQNDFFDLTVTSNNHTKDVKWACISSPDFYSDEAEHLHRKEAFDLWLQDIRPITLLESTKSPDKKTVDLRDDHGKDKLAAHAKLLCNHPNVEAILTSLPFKPYGKNYISRIYDDGTVDIVLYWEDEGFSMRVKTTGRNITETKKIAGLLKDKYGRP